MSLVIRLKLKRKEKNAIRNLSQFKYTFQFWFWFTIEINNFDFVPSDKICDNEKNIYQESVLNHHELQRCSKKKIFQKQMWSYQEFSCNVITYLKKKIKTSTKIIFFIKKSKIIYLKKQKNNEKNISTNNFVVFSIDFYKNNLQQQIGNEVKNKKHWK